LAHDYTYVSDDVSDAVAVAVAWLIKNKYLEAEHGLRKE
jgi:hypothetical protein